jgi:hypothetical protein
VPTFGWISNGTRSPCVSWAIADALVARFDDC